LRKELDQLRGQSSSPDDAARASALQADVDRLRREADDLRVQLAAKPTPGGTLPPPTIEILDPKVPLTRGVKIVQTFVAESSRVIVGHVDAPAGLLSLTLNDASLDVSDKGMFRSEVRVQSQGTRVMIVATDRQGTRAEREFSLAPGAEDAPGGVAPVSEP